MKLEIFLKNKNKPITYSNTNRLQFLKIKKIDIFKFFFIEEEDNKEYYGDIELNKIERIIVTCFKPIYSYNEENKRKIIKFIERIEIDSKKVKLVYHLTENGSLTDFTDKINKFNDIMEVEIQ